MDYNIWLSPPDLGTQELNYTERALLSNKLASFGDNIEHFKSQLRSYTRSSFITLTNTGTAAIHVALKSIGVKKGDYVICPTNTFIATVNPVLYLHANPVLIDSEPHSWNMDPMLLEKALKSLYAQNIKPKAILTVELYGMPYYHEDIHRLSLEYDVPIIEDSAEALGSRYMGQPCGSLGEIGIFSFNANKIITTSGGGALITSNKNISLRAAYLINQAKSDKPYFWHKDSGFNYNFSNILAGIGRAQMEKIDSFITQRRANFDFYKKSIMDPFNRVSTQLEPENTFSNRWLSCFVFPTHQHKENIRIALNNHNIECRNLWTPLHLMPLLKNTKCFKNGVSEQLFERGLCLPSGSNLRKSELEEIAAIIRKELL